jgi:hypothetical protein
MSDAQNIFVTRQLLRQAMPNASERVIIAFEQMFLNNNVIIDVAPSDGGTAIAMIGSVSAQIPDIQAGVESAANTANNAISLANNTQASEFNQAPDPYSVSMLSGITDVIQMPDPYTSAALANSVSFSFTPSVAGSTVAGVGTYTAQYGSYQLIGRFIFFVITLKWTAHSGTGNLTITGLPQAALNISSLATPINIVVENLAKGSDTISAYVGSNSTTILVVTSGNNSVFSPVAMDSSANIYISGFYEV